MNSDHLTTQAKRVQEAKRALEREHRELDHAIRTAARVDKMSYRAIAKHVGLSSQRVGQILKENER